MKIKKCLLINLFFIIVIFCIFDFFILKEYEKNPAVATFLYNKFNFTLSTIDNYNIDTSLYELENGEYEKLPMNHINFEKFCGEKRYEYNTDKFEKSPIYILGCSYAYGHGLNKEETFSYILSNKTKYPVYNFAMCGSDIITSIKIMNNYRKEKDIKPPKYIIYLYMNDHINRYLYNYNVYNFYNFLYTEQEPNLNHFLFKSRLYKFFYINFHIKNILKKYPDTTKSSLFCKEVFLRSYSYLKQQFPNTKVIYIIYNEKLMKEYPQHYIKFVSDTMNDTFWDELKKLPDLEVVKTKDIMGFSFDKNYKLEADFSDWHPNARAWEEFTPKFAEKYIE